MKERLLSFLQHLRDFVSPENARAIARAYELIAPAAVVTYDDYVDAMSTVRHVLVTA